MLKNKFLVILLILKLNNCSFIKEPKYWLTTCSLNNCTHALSYCSNCYGERGCKSCINEFKPECSNCANDIYNKNDLENINGIQYMLCDSSDEFQLKVCHLYCRGQFFDSGQCERLLNFPICKCLRNEITTTTRISSNCSNSNNFLNGFITAFGFIDGYKRIYSLPNGDILRGSSGSFFQIIDSNSGFVKRNFTTIYTSPYVFGLLSNGDLVTGYYNNKTLVVWDLNTTGEPLKRIIQTNESFLCLTILKNDDLAIGQQSGSSNYDIVIRDSINGLIKKRLVGHANNVYQILVLPNDNLLSSSADNTVKIWNASNATPIMSKSFPSSVLSSAILKNGYIASGLADSTGSIHIWDLNTLNTIRILTGHTGRICWNNCLLLLNNGDLLSASYDGSLKVWNTYDGSIKGVRQTTNAIYQLLPLPNGNILTSSSNQIVKWN